MKFFRIKALVVPIAKVYQTNSYNKECSFGCALVNLPTQKALKLNSHIRILLRRHLTIFCDLYSKFTGTTGSFSGLIQDLNLVTKVRVRSVSELSLRNTYTYLVCTLYRTKKLRFGNRLHTY